MKVRQKAQIAAIILFVTLIALTGTLIYVESASHPIQKKETLILLKGHVVDRVTGLPVSNASVIANTDETYYMKAVSNDTGYFRIITRYPVSNMMKLTIFHDDYYTLYNDQDLFMVSLDLLEQTEYQDIYGTIEYLLELPPKEVNATGGATVSDVVTMLSHQSYNSDIESCRYSFNLYATDNNGLSGYVFSTNNTGMWKNDTWVGLAGVSAWMNTTKILNTYASERTTSYKWYVNDTGNNWVASPQYLLKELLDCE